MSAEEAEKAKNEGNEAFKNKHFKQAIELYTKAIELNPEAAPYYSNRAFAHIKLEAFGAALQDAEKCIELDSNYIKGYYRRASANMGLAKWKVARRDFEIVLKKRPNDADAKNKHKLVDKTIRRIAFEKAISDGNPGTTKDLVELMDKVEVEASYDGPHLGEEITVEFMNELVETLRGQKKLHRKYVMEILRRSRDFFRSQPSVVDITVPEGSEFTVCGDVHGQFYDVLNIFKINGFPSENNPYLFNGDFVDRGSFSVEVIITFLGYKLLYPNHFYMSRGNHETINMNQMYGFEGEVKAKYNAELAEVFTEVFNWLPLAHVINNKIFVVHGGLFSDDDITLDELRKIERNRQPPDSGPMNDMLWSDPYAMKGRGPSPRGAGMQFGPDITKAFLEKNNLELVIRSHQMKEEGYEVEHDGKCITIFSAPNYCDSMGNKGALIRLKAPDLKPKFIQFEAVSHPPVKAMAYAGSFMSMFGF